MTQGSSVRARWRSVILVTPTVNAADLPHLRVTGRAPPKPRFCAGGQHMLPCEETPGQAGRNLLAGSWETGSTWRASGGL